MGQKLPANPVQLRRVRITVYTPLATGPGLPLRFEENPRSVRPITVL